MLLSALYIFCKYNICIHLLEGYSCFDLASAKFGVWQGTDGNNTGDHVHDWQPTGLSNRRRYLRYVSQSDMSIGLNDSRSCLPMILIMCHLLAVSMLTVSKKACYQTIAIRKNLRSFLLLYISSFASVALRIKWDCLLLKITLLTVCSEVSLQEAQTYVCRILVQWLQPIFMFSVLMLLYKKLTIEFLRWRRQHMRQFTLALTLSRTEQTMPMFMTWWYYDSPLKELEIDIQSARGTVVLLHLYLYY